MKNIFLIILLLGLCLPSPAQPNRSKPIIFITDASGSMWQKIGDEFKITIASLLLNSRPLTGASGKKLVQ